MKQLIFVLGIVINRIIYLLINNYIILLMSGLFMIGFYVITMHNKEDILLVNRLNYIERQMDEIKLRHSRTNDSISMQIHQLERRLIHYDSLYKGEIIMFNNQ